MPSFAVKQPNGLYAGFSTIVDNFLHNDATREQVLNYWRRECGDAGAEAKVSNADEEAFCSVTTKQEPLARWRGCLNTILVIHGPTVLREALEQVALTPEERERWLTETVKGAA